MTWDPDINLTTEQIECNDITRYNGLACDFYYMILFSQSKFSASGYFLR